MANRAIIYRLYPTASQKLLLTKTFGCCRFVYNRLLSVQQERYKNGEKHLSRTHANNFCNRQLKPAYPFLRNVLHVSLDYLSGLSEIPNSHNNKVIPLEKALEYCDKQRQMWHEYSLKALKNNNRMDSVGAVALGDRNEVMYGYEIPNILRLLCKDKEIL